MKRSFFFLICLALPITLPACKDRAIQHHESSWSSAPKTVVHGTAQVINIEAGASVQIFNVDNGSSKTTSISAKNTAKASEATIVSSSDTADAPSIEKSLDATLASQPTATPITTPPVVKAAPAVKPITTPAVKIAPAIEQMDNKAAAKKAPLLEKTADENIFDENPFETEAAPLDESFTLEDISDTTPSVKPSTIENASDIPRQQLITP